jgi:integrase
MNAHIEQQGTNHSKENSCTGPPPKRPLSHPRISYRARGRAADEGGWRQPQRAPGRHHDPAGFRHGLRASELCSLRWEQVDLVHGRLHVSRAKNGIDTVHPLTGTELRALRRLQREQEPGRYVFMSERGASRVDVLTSQGRPVAEAVRTIGVTEVTYYRWRSEYGGLNAQQSAMR